HRSTSVPRLRGTEREELGPGSCMELPSITQRSADSARRIRHGKCDGLRSATRVCVGYRIACPRHRAVTKVPAESVWRGTTCDRGGECYGATDNRIPTNSKASR